MFCVWFGLITMCVWFYDIVSCILSVLALRTVTISSSREVHVVAIIISSSGCLFIGRSCLGEFMWCDESAVSTIPAEFMLFVGIVLGWFRSGGRSWSSRSGRFVWYALCGVVILLCLWLCCRWDRRRSR